MSIDERNEASSKFWDESGFDFLVCNDAAGGGIDIEILYGRNHHIYPVEIKIHIHESLVLGEF